MESRPDDARIWGSADRPLELLARNVGTRYLALLVDGLIGLLLLPFNVAHLGPSAYGLWMLTASVTWFFGVLDLGYGGSVVKFVAQYRAWRDRAALNEILSTIAVVLTGIGGLCFVVTLVLAWQLPRIFNIDPAQVPVARSVLLIIGAYLTIRFAFAIFGSVVYGFQRYYLNNGVSIGVSVIVAAVNIGVLGAGHGLVALVAATTVVRLLSLGFFAMNAYRVFPGLRVRPTLFRRERLKEVTGFSVYMLVLDWSAKLNYSADALIIGAVLNTVAVAVWTVAQRLSQVSQQLTNQLNDALFPLVVDSDAAHQNRRLQVIMTQSTKWSLACAAPLCIGLITLADPLIHAWVGSGFAESVLPTRILLLVVLVRTTTASANMILKGAGQHRLLALTNAATAAVNIGLSLALIRPFGLVGVAAGTLLPVSFSAVFVLYPAACRRVGLPLRQPLLEAVWPATWPAAVMLAAMWLLAPRGQAGLPAIIASLALGALLYAAFFLAFGTTREERRLYGTKLRNLVWRRPVAADPLPTSASARR
jgi:O-antigen/teichoic acid export membrane protein